MTYKACVKPFTLSFHVKPVKNGRQLHAGCDIRIINRNEQARGDTSLCGLYGYVHPQG